MSRPGRLLGYRSGMQPRFNGNALISDDVPGLSAFYGGLLRATVEGDGTFAFIRGPGAYRVRSKPAAMRVCCSSRRRRTCPRRR
jgi:hypothetical protein